MTEQWDIREEKLYTRLLWLSIIASILIFFWGIWSIPFLSHNEGRRGQVVQEMLANKDWLIPTLNGEVYVSKPPLFYWIAGLFALLFHSTAEWVMRLPSALSALGVTWIMFDRVKKYIGRWPALFSAIILLTSATFTKRARVAEIEMLLTLCCTLVMIFFWDYLKKPEGRKSLLLCYACLGLAFLVKGPVALVFFVPPLLLLWLIQRDRNILKGLGYLPGWLILAILAAPWFLYIYSLGDGSMAAVVKRDISERTFWGGERDPFYQYLGDALLNFLPWTLAMVWQTKSRVKSIVANYDTALMGAWLVAPLIIMSFFGTKHGKYILPLYPVAAVVLATWTVSLGSVLESRFPLKAHSIVSGLVVCLLTGWFVFYSVIEPRVYRHGFVSLDALVEKVEQIRGDAPVYSYGDPEPRLIYYFKKPLPVVNDEDIDRILKQRQPLLIVAESKTDDWGALDGSPSFCLVEEFKDYIKKRQTARLYGTLRFCRSKITAVSKTTNEQTK